MDGRYIGHRGSRGSDWTWEEGAPGKKTGRNGRGRAWAILMALALAAAAALTVVTLVLTLGGGGDAGKASPTPFSTPSRAPSPSPAPTGSPTPRPTAVAPATATPAASATPAGPMVAPRLAVWSTKNSRWLAEDLAATPSGYREGDAMPFLLRIDGAKAGTAFEAQLKYDCKSGGAAAFDFLVSVPDQLANQTATADGGPGRQRPDSTIPVPDDLSISPDDADGRSLRLWGGTFQGPPTGPEPATACRNEKTVTVGILARQETVFLMWGAHLASAADWGASNAASAASAFGMRAIVNGGATAAVNVPAGAIAP